MNKIFKKVSIALIIFFLSLAVSFVEIRFAIERAERNEAEKRTAEFETKLIAYITENAAAFERLAAYELEHAEPQGGVIDFYIDPYGELQEERNIAFTIGQTRVLSDIGGSNPRVIFMSMAGLNDVSVIYLPDGIGEHTEKISDNLYYTTYKDPHYW
ncbi:MAG: hypothetical protein K2H90_02610 [Oscillospiraceae bacterium]|nr:hypothetical protein [Oscillospiraceae bacterium]